MLQNPYLCTDFKKIVCALKAPLFHKREIMKKRELLKRYFIFTIALFVSALGVSIITRSYLGTSPISSIPYVLSLNTSLSMGTYIFLFNMVLIIGQLLMLDKEGIFRRKIDLLMQIPISVIFGLFIDLTMALLSHLAPTLYAFKLISLCIGCAVLALGICFEVVADVTMVSGEYFVQIASLRSRKEFGFIKIIFDVSLVIIATLASWLLSGHIEGVREGTVIAALITGPFVRLFKPLLVGIERWEAGNSVPTQVEETAALAQAPIIITISREYGSGGHLIGQQIAEHLGIPFYDNSLIELVAKESGFSEDFISEKEQNLPSHMLYQLILQDYESPINKSLSPSDALFVAQSRVIRRLAQKGASVIVGRCADYILRDFPNCIHVFLHANMAYKITHAIHEYGIDPENAAHTITQINKSREAHYNHYTGKRWEDTNHYHLTCDTSMIDNDEVCRMVEGLYNKKQQSEVNN